MNFIKNNIIFTIVMFLTLVGSAYLIYMDMSKYSAISEANEVTTQSQKEFQDANRKKGNKPGDKNVQMINNDTVILRGKVRELQRIFGNPYRNALLSFAKSVQISEDELRGMLKELYEDENNKVKTSSVLIPLLLQKVAAVKKLPREKVDALFLERFISEAQKRTIESLDIYSGHELFGVALGMSRQMTPTVAWEHLRRIQGQMQRQYLIPGVKTLDGVQNFTYNQFVQRPPTGADVEDILEMLPIYEDIFRFRLNESGVVSVNDFKRIGIPVVVSEHYREHKFEVTVRGSVASVRKFASLLQEAYKDNQVYVVNWVSIVADESIQEVDELRKRLTGADQNTNDNNSRNVRARRRTRDNARRQNNRGRNSTVIRKVALDPDSKDYGKALIGVGNEVSAVIKFSYFVYTGEKINRKN